MGKRLVIILLAWAASCLPTTPSAHGYRPFDSTDADVAERGELQVKLGFFQVSGDKRIDNAVCPSLTVNYGFFPGWELGAGADLQVYTGDEKRSAELLDPALTVKWLLRQGILQDRSGPSFAVEFGLLLPSTVLGERKVGSEVLGILSVRLASFDCHFNLGVGLDREDRNANLPWGIITEYPLSRELRVGLELNGTVKEGGPSDTSSMVGLIWDLGRAGLDVGIRKGLSKSAPEWEATAGITISFSLLEQ